MDIWKEFEHNEITHSGAHYLMTIHKLIHEEGYARVSDVARSMHITPGSASIMIKSLKEKGYLEEDRNRFLRLTDEGNRLAQSVSSHRQTLITFLLYFAPTPGGAGLAEIVSATVMSIYVPRDLTPSYILLWRIVVSYLTVGFGSTVFWYWLKGAEGRRASAESD